jgi:hypothetical protein
MKAFVRFKRDKMNEHKFKIGQLLFYCPHRAPKTKSQRYVVLKLLPQRNGELRYRIRSQNDASEYSARESELCTS